MKFKKILSGVLASSMLVSAMPVFSASAADTDVTGNSIFDAVEISFDEIISGECTQDDYDWYKITLPKSGKINMTLVMNVDFNSKSFQIVDATEANNIVATKSGLKTGTYTDVYYLTAGDYYINFYNEAWDAFDYEFKLIYTSSDVTFDGTDNNAIGKASAVEYDGTVYNGQLSLNDSIDYYTFDVAEQGRVTLNFNTTMDNADWELYNSEDKRIKKGVFVKGEKDNSITEKESNILKEGKYTIAIQNSNGLYGNYSFSLDYIQNYNDLSVSGIIAAGDIDGDGKIDASDASFILMYYAYLSTGGTETDMNKWLANNK